jgi:hypothetical protein
LKLERSELVGRDLERSISTRRARDGDAAIGYKRAALAARAETLREKNAFEIHQGGSWLRQKEGTDILATGMLLSLATTARATPGFTLSAP